MVLGDEVTEHFLKIFASLYADDIIVLVAESDFELQRALKAVHEYCEMWQLTVSTDKTKIISFSKGIVANYLAFVLATII